MHHTKKNTVELRIADNDNDGGTAEYDAALVSIVRMLARHSAKAAQSANDNRRPEAK